MAPTERIFVRLGAPRRVCRTQALGMHDHLAHPELPPGPNRFPLRNLYRLTTDGTELFEEARAQFGDVFTIRAFGTRPLVCFATAEASREIMRQGSDRLGASADVIQSIVGEDAVILKNGAPHALHRRRLMPALTGEALFAHAPAMRRVAEASVDALGVGAAVAVLPWARRSTLDVIQRCLFGMSDGEAYRALAHDVIQLAEEGQRPLALMASMVAPPALVERVTRGRFDAHGDRIADPLPIRAMLRHPLVSANRRVRDRLLAHVRGAREGRIDVPESSMLAALLRLAKQQSTELADRELVDDLILLLIAGHDTTAVTLTWLVLLLARHPEVLADLRRELDAAGGGESLDAERLGQLPFLDATIRESMRMRNITSGFARTTLVPTTIAGVSLPADVTVHAIVNGPQFDPVLFDEPRVFDPRHMSQQRVKPENWFPFGGGYRRCAGAFFATLELKIFLATFVSRVSFDAVDRSGPLGGGARGIISAPLDRGLIRVHSTRGFVSRASTSAEPRLSSAAAEVS